MQALTPHTMGTPAVWNLNFPGLNAPLQTPTPTTARYFFPTDSVESPFSPPPSLAPTGLNGSNTTMPGGFPGTFTLPQFTDLGSIAGELAGGSLGSASLGSDLDWLAASSEDCGSNACGGNQPLTINAWPYNGSPVTNVQIQQVGVQYPDVNVTFYSGTAMEQSATDYGAQSQQQYYVTVTWADGSSYQTVTNNVGALTVTQPN